MKSLWWKLGILAAVALAPSRTIAGTWSVSSASASPGETTEINVYFQGDGETVAADARLQLDDPLITIDAEPGEILDAARDGRCGWNGAGLVGAILFDDTFEPLPTEKILVCQLSIRVRDDALNRLAEIRVVESQCGGRDAQDSECGEAQSGFIDIYGGTDIDPDDYLFSKESTRVLVLLREGELSEQLRELAASRVDAPGLRDVLPEFNELGYKHLYAAVPPSSRVQGDVLKRLIASPHLPAAKAQRTIVLDFPDFGRRDNAIRRLSGNPNVESVSIDPGIQTVTVRDDAERKQKDSARVASTPPSGAKAVTGILPQPHLSQLGIPSAQAITGGWGLVGIIDMGLATSHEELRSFTGSGSIGGNFVIGGNFLPDASMNISDPLRNPAPTAIDALIPSIVLPGEESCDPDNNGLLEYSYAGHGTHVAGLVGANSADGDGVSGVCANCGIAAFRMTNFYCSPPSNVYIAFKSTAGMIEAAEMGVQVLNMSFGSADGINCNAVTGTNYNCLAVDAAVARDVAVVAASGNFRKQKLQVPASDPRVIAVGGVEDSAGTFWDDYPTPGCPYPSPSYADCGSNYSDALSTGYSWQELGALAKNAVSTTYPSHNWSPAILCGDSWGSSSTSDGLGTCTGTSMSTPEVAGIVGLLRSINPLVKVGRAGPDGPQMQGGIRQVLAETASRTQGGLAWDNKLGFGTPNAGLAARRLLGTTRGEVVQNRAIPLFSLYSSGSQDHAAVATPQMAMHLALDSASAYLPDGNSSLAIQGYSTFPDPSAGAPRARVYILSTDKKPDPAFPPLVPLYLMEKIGSGSLRDHVLLSDPSVVQSAANSSPRYRYLGLQGYVYQECQGSPGCTVPPGAEILHLKCKSGWDCAVFPESDRLTGANFNGQGYVNLFPGMSNSRLGYAYSRGDFDGDGLPDAAERVLSTRHDLQDTDGDGLTDAQEYPFADIPVSDPCDGPLDRCTRPSTYIFDDGFEGGS